MEVINTTNKTTYLFAERHTQTCNFTYKDWDFLKVCAATPYSCDKKETPCIGMHDGQAKTKAPTIKHDNMTLLWLDLDKKNIQLSTIKDTLKAEGIISFVAYTTISAKPENLRWRVFIELKDGIPCNLWQDLQRYLAYLLCADDCGDRVQQIAYLPNNQSGFYRHFLSEGDPLDAHNANHQLINNMLLYKAQIERLEQKATQESPAPSQNVTPLKTNQTSPIKAFNEANALPYLLARYGFKKVGNKWLHPESESGEPGVTIIEGRYHSHHSSDPLADGRTHDSFDLFCGFEHQWNYNAALKAAGGMFTTDEGVSVSKSNQRKHMAAIASPVVAEVVSIHNAPPVRGYEQAPAGQPISKLPDFPDIRKSKEGNVRVLNTSSNLAALCEFIGVTPRYNRMAIEIGMKGFKCAADEKDAQIRSHLIDSAVKAGLPKISIEDHLTRLAVNNAYHPVVEWLESSVWDGKHRMREVIACLNFNEPQHGLEVMRKWFVSAIAALYADNFSTKINPVLQGDQSYMKTAALKRICSLPIPENKTFLEGASIDPTDRDSIKKCIKHWIVELGELESTTKRCASQLKAFLTNEYDQLRLPFAKTETKKPRQTVFIGTVNGTGFLKDPTGSTRFQTLSMDGPVEIDRLNKLLGYKWDGSTAKLANPELMRQFWLEAKALYDKGHNWTLTAKEQAFSLAENEGHTEGLDYEDALLELVASEERDHWHTAKEVAELLLIPASDTTSMKRLQKTLGAMYGSTKNKMIGGQQGKRYNTPKLVKP